MRRGGDRRNLNWNLEHRTKDSKDGITHRTN